MILIIFIWNKQHAFAFFSVQSTSEIESPTNDLKLHKNRNKTNLMKLQKKMLSIPWSQQSHRNSGLSAVKGIMEK